MSIVLAYSGGLDTSFCIPFLKEKYGVPLYTVSVNTGGIQEEEVEALSERALKLGADEHFTIDARADLFENHLAWLIKGNVLRGGVYPLCVGSERVVQAKHIVAKAKELGARAVAHGSTGAGNDQVRFDVALRVLGQDLQIITPIRDEGLSRTDTSAYLVEKGFAVPSSTTEYSINTGLWGSTIGGKETLGTVEALPDEAYSLTASAQDAPDMADTFELSFEAGLPVAIDDVTMDPVVLIESLNTRAAASGVGRDIHVGDTILGIKGRIGFEAPAATVLLTAHRELEKIVLTKWQRFQKDHLADFYGMLLHEGQYFDPVMRDIESFLDSSQKVVCGKVSVKLYKGHVSVPGCESPHSMFDAAVATYGESNTLWDGRDARGFSRIAGLQSYLAAQAHNPGNDSQKAPSSLSTSELLKGTPLL